MRRRNRTLSPCVLACAGALVLLGPHPSAFAQTHRGTVSVHVDSVLATNTREGVDNALAPMGNRLRSLFPYSTYRLLRRDNGQTQCGHVVSFTLPGGRIIRVEPRAIDGDMISMELILFQGSRPMMTTELKLRNHGVLMVGGPRYKEGMLIISIGASAVEPVPAGAGTPMAAQRP